MDKMGAMVASSVASSSMTSILPYLYGGAQNGRKALIQDLGDSIPELPVQFFLDHLFPGLRQGLDVNATVKRLKRNTRAGIVKDRWKAFKCEPRESPLSENATFQPLTQLGAAIASASGLGKLKPSLKFQTNPNSTSKSSMRDAKSRPDGYFIVSGSSPKEVRWMDIALVAEFKKRNIDRDVDDDIRNMIWSMQQCMREDPHRRFIFGITIENTDMRLWYCSRAELLVSEKIKWMEELTTVVHVFLSIMYAQRHEVGWDPSVRYVTDDKGVIQYDSTGRPRFDISVWSANGETADYRTTRLISDAGANALRGRGTRVWEVKELVNGEEIGEPAVLKEAWIDDDQNKEGNILDSIRNDMDMVEREIFGHLFLTVLRHGDVLVHGKPDHTRNLMTRGKDVSPACTRFRLQVEEDVLLEHAATAPNKGRASRTGPGAAEAHKRKLLDKLTTYHSKVHYRIIFKEVCEPIYTLKSLGDIFKVLRRITLALQLMHEQGWVHRDISTGNILVYRQNGKLSAKLADLEYARKLNVQNTHEIRIGTSNFMAVEVDLLRYLFRPKRLGEMPEDDADPLEKLDQIAQDEKARLPNRSISAKALKRPMEKITFRYNPLHDLESIWWVATYFILNRSVVSVNGAVVSRSNTHPSDEEEQQIYAAQLFYDQAIRLVVMSAEGYFEQHIGCLHESVRPFAYGLESARRQLVAQYLNAEKHPNSINEDVAQGLYTAFDNMFSQALTQDIMLNHFKQNVATVDVEVVDSDTKSSLPALSGQLLRKGKRRMEDPALDEGAIDEGADTPAGPSAQASSRPLSRKRSKPVHPTEARFAGPVTRSRSKATKPRR